MGLAEGAAVGAGIGVAVGVPVEGDCVGPLVTGAWVGEGVCPTAVGAPDGEAVGVVVGDSVPPHVTTSAPGTYSAMSHPELVKLVGSRVAPGLMVNVTSDEVASKAVAPTTAPDGIAIPLRFVQNWKALTPITATVGGKSKEAMAVPRKAPSAITARVAPGAPPSKDTVWRVDPANAKLETEMTVDGITKVETLVCANAAKPMVSRACDVGRVSESIKQTIGRTRVSREWGGERGVGGWVGGEQAQDND